jgi:hypothetical protein
MNSRIFKVHVRCSTFAPPPDGWMTALSHLSVSLKVVYILYNSYACREMELWWKKFCYSASSPSLLGNWELRFVYSVHKAEYYYEDFQGLGLTVWGWNKYLLMMQRFGMQSNRIFSLFTITSSQTAVFFHVQIIRQFLRPRLQGNNLILAFISTAILYSESYGTHRHIVTCMSDYKLGLEPTTTSKDYAVSVLHTS